MRSFRITELNTILEHDERTRPMEETMELWVKFHGATAAAWLMWQYRKQLHRNGAQDFFVPKNKQSPPWFRVAIETLKRRQNWSVTMVGNASSANRTYRVRWMAHTRYLPHPQVSAAGIA